MITYHYGMAMIDAMTRDPQLPAMSADTPTVVSSLRQIRKTAAPHLDHVYFYKEVLEMDASRFLRLEKLETQLCKMADWCDAIGAHLQVQISHGGQSYRVDPGSCEWVPSTLLKAYRVTDPAAELEMKVDLLGQVFVLRDMVSQAEARKRRS